MRLKNKNVDRLSADLIDGNALSQILGADICTENLIDAYESARVSTYILGSDKLRKATGTLKQYKNIIKRLKAVEKSNECPFLGLEKLIEESKLSTKTISTYRTALRSYAARSILKCGPSIVLRTCYPSNTQSLRDFFNTYEFKYVKHSKDWQIDELRKSILFLTNNPLQSIGRFHLRQLPSPANYNRKPTNSKRDDITYFENYLKKRKPSVTFKDAIWSHFSDVGNTQPRKRWKQVAAGVSILTGCRPSEYVKGVLLIVADEKSTNERFIGFRISGTKCSADANADNDIVLTSHELELAALKNNDQAEINYNNRGQKHRYIFWSNNNPITNWFHDYICETGCLDQNLHDTVTEELTQHNFTAYFVKAEPKNIPQNAAERKRAADNLGKMFVREGKKIFPSAERNLTPYVFRHALASEFRANTTLPNETVSYALGHQSDRSKNHYGSFTKSNVTPKCANVIVSASNTLRKQSQPWEQRHSKNKQNYTI